MTSSCELRRGLGGEGRKERREEGKKEEGEGEGGEGKRREEERER